MGNYLYRDLRSAHTALLLHLLLQILLLQEEEREGRQEGKGRRGHEGSSADGRTGQRQGEFSTINKMIGLFILFYLRDDCFERLFIHGLQSLIWWMIDIRSTMFKCFPPLNVVC